MAVLTQADYENLAPQLVNAKRTAGANSGKKITGVETWRGYHVGGNISGDPTLQVRLVYSDGTSEILSFGASVEAFAPGSADTMAHLHGG